MSDEIVVTCKKHGPLTEKQAYRNALVTLCNGISKYRYVCKACVIKTNSAWAIKKYNESAAFRAKRAATQKRYLARKKLKLKKEKKGSA